MPELPEVETVVRGLRKTIIGKRIADVHNFAPARSIEISETYSSKTIDEILLGRKIEEVKRRGKNILIGLSGKITLWIHLKMTGHLFYLSSFKAVEKHDLVVIDLGKNSQGTNKAPISQLRFNDYRRFGRFRIYPNNELWAQKGLRELGPEPLEIKSGHFLSLCRNRNCMIKSALLDQTFLAGIGNIYADEALHSARLHPQRLTSSIANKKLIELDGHIKKLLRKSIRSMGTTVDSYSGVDGRPGSFQKYLRAYGCSGQPCQFCGRAIVREKIGSRSAHFCPRCQRPPRKK